jgi:predicted enzyme related to lactoylglutathione lyase
MPEETKPAPGSIGWVDLTVPDAGRVRDFYSAVVGWTPTGLDMGGYEDFCMNAPGGATVAGICHSRGGNAGLPPVWLVYITVANLEASLKNTVERGGRIVAPPRSAGTGRYAVIEDPAGAVAALFQPD